MSRVLVSRFSDCEKLAPRLREADLQEVQACGVQPLEALQMGFLASRWCFTAFPDVGEDRPILRFGVGDFPQESGTGIIWLLGSDDILKVSHEFLRESKWWIKTFQDHYPILTNCVDARNVVHIKWLKWLGFRAIKMHAEYGVEKRPFYEFVRI